MTQQVMLSDSEIRTIVVDTLGVTLWSGAVSGATPMRVTTGTGDAVKTDNKKFEMVVTVSTFPSGTKDADDRTLTLRVQVNAAAVFSIQTTPAFTPVPGGASLQSGLYTFTLVSKLPTVPDTDSTVPTVTIAAPGEPNDDDNLEFGYTVADETALKDDVIRSNDIEVRNGTLVEVTNDKIIVNPDSDTAKVTVTVAEGAVTDTSDNASDEKEAFFAPEGYNPTVSITADDELDDDDEATGNIVFTLDFSESVMSFTVANIEVSNVGLLGLDDLSDPIMSTADAPLPEGVSVRYTLTVTPTDAAEAVTVTIKAGALMTTATAPDPFDSAQESHTLTADDDGDDDGDDDPMDPEEGPTVSPLITIPGDGFVVVVRDDGVGHALALTAHNPDIELIVWSDMPDLETLFDPDALTGGGALILTQSVTQPAAKSRDPGTVGISEVMWAIDESELGNAALQKANQWIELHNLNPEAGTDNGNAKVILSARAGATDISTDTDINGDLTTPRLDVVTNAFNNRPGTAFWTFRVRTVIQTQASTLSQWLVIRNVVRSPLPVDRKNAGKPLDRKVYENNWK